jgi:hypothetical protein
VDAGSSILHSLGQDNASVEIDVIGRHGERFGITTASAIRSQSGRLAESLDFSSFSQAAQ